jgi:hypothetical protein
MRRSEIITAGLMALFSIYLMVKSSELDIGYIKGEGPGGGFWPFWLSAIMLVCTGLIAVNWLRRTSPPSRSTDVMIDDYGMRMLMLVGGGLTVFIGLIYFVGMYGATFLFLVYYIRFLGRHAWVTTLLVAVGVPVFLFFFFDVSMRLILPKGYLEPLFLPLYDIFL